MPADPLALLAERAHGPRGLVVGACLSGTSMDAVDVAVVRGRLDAAGRLAEPFELLDARATPLPPSLAGRLAEASSGASLDARARALLDRDVALAFAQSVDAGRRAAGVALDLVASHGQTVGHHDGRDGADRWTAQLGDGDVLAEALGVPVAFDFRAADVAAGGEGAPLVPLVDGELFATLPRPAAILNLGGVANLTFLDAGPPRGFDVGPANVLLDGLARALLDLAFDPDGATAAEGRADDELADRWLAHPYFERVPPKSTGRDTFDVAWVAARLKEGAGRSAPDLCATGARAVGRSVGLALARHGPAGLERLVVAGGGWHHRPLRAELARATGLPVEPSDAWGVPVDHREALAFALLGLRSVAGVPSALPAVTGARGPRVLGKLAHG